MNYGREIHIRVRKIEENPAGTPTVEALVCQSEENEAGMKMKQENREDRCLNMPSLGCCDGAIIHIR